MADFATRIQHAKSRLMGTATETIPVPFTVSCACGETLEGLRRNSWTQVQCESCNETHFVLPVNVYPTSTRVPSLVLDGSFLQRLKVVVGELVAPKSETTAEAKSEKTPRAERVEDYAPPPRVAESVPKEQRGEPAPQEETASGAQEEVLAFPTKQRRPISKKLFTPVRMLVAGAVLAAIATGWWITHQNRLESARNLWRSSMDEVEIALEQQDVSGLLSPLESAVEAAAILQKRDADVFAAENLLLQVTAVANLSQIDLLREIDDVVAVDAGEREDAVRIMNSAISGQWFILECPVRQNARLDRGVEFVMPDGSTSLPVYYVAEAEWPLSAQQDLGGAPLLLAVKVLDISTNVAGLSGLVVRFDAKQLALLTEEIVAEDAGLIADDVTIDRLQRQQEFIHNGGKADAEPAESQEKDES